MQATDYYYHNRHNPDQVANVMLFALIVNNNLDIEFFFPNREDAPWHVQAKVGDILMNFWPHLLKGQYPGEKGVVGEMAICRMLDRARLDAEDTSAAESLIE